MITELVNIFNLQDLIYTYITYIKVVAMSLACISYVF